MSIAPGGAPVTCASSGGNGGGGGRDIGRARAGRAGGTDLEWVGEAAGTSGEEGCERVVVEAQGF